MRAAFYDDLQPLCVINRVTAIVKNRSESEFGLIGVKDESRFGQDQWIGAGRQWGRIRFVPRIVTFGSGKVDETELWAFGDRD
jgi:hypothetical protein